MANRFDGRRRSLSIDSYDHLQRGRRYSGDFGRSARRSPDYDLYSRPRRRSRERSPDDYVYSRARRHSIEGRPSDYYSRRRPYSDDFGYIRKSRYSGDYGGGYGQVFRRYSYDGFLPESSGRMRRYFSDPHINYTSYGQSTYPVGGIRSGYTMYSQPGPVVNYIRHQQPRVEYIQHNPVQYVHRAIEQPPPVQYVHRAIEQPPPVQYVQTVQQPVVQQVVQQPTVRYVQQPAPVQYVQRPAVKHVQYVQRPVIAQQPVVVQKPVIAPTRYQINGNLTPVVTGPGTIQVKYDNLDTKYDIQPSTIENVREVREYGTQPMTVGNTYTAFVLGKNGTSHLLDEGHRTGTTRVIDTDYDDRGLISNGYQYDYRERSRGNNKSLDHVLYFGNGKMKEVYGDSDYNNNFLKSRIIR